MRAPVPPIVKGRPERGNRIALAAIGLVSVIAGGYGLARGWGVFGDPAAHQPILTAGVRAFVHRNHAVFWAVAFLVALLFAFVGYRWLRAQLPSTGHSHVIDLGDPDTTPGRGVPGETELRAQRVGAALAGDVATYPGVAAAAARIEQVASDAPIVVDIRIDLRDGAPVEPVQQQLAEHGLLRLRQALDVERLDARLHVRLAGDSQRHLN